jgi:hypothetical protein
MSEEIMVSKRDLIQVWSVLENLRVSLHRIGSAYARDSKNSSAPSNQSDQQVSRLHHQELEALGAYLTPELYSEVADAWRVLSEYLPDEETAALAEEQIHYWEPVQESMPTI